MPPENRGSASGVLGDASRFIAASEAEPGDLHVQQVPGDAAPEAILREKLS